MIKFKAHKANFNTLGQSDLHDTVFFAKEHLCDVYKNPECQTDEMKNIAENAATYEWTCSDIDEGVYGVFSKLWIKGKYIDLNDACSCDENKTPAEGRRVAEKMAREAGCKYFIDYTAANEHHALLGLMAMTHNHNRREFG